MEVGHGDHDREPRPAVEDPELVGVDAWATLASPAFRRLPRRSQIPAATTTHGRRWRAGTMGR
jgi:hypothetical protein